MRKALLLVMMSGVLASCRPEIRYSSFRSVPAQMWERTDTVTFSVPAEAAAADCDMSVSLRLGRPFPYTMLYVQVECMPCGSVTARRDTLCIQVGDSLDRLRSNGMNLLYYELLSLPVHLPEGQGCEIRVTHLMRRNPLPHVSDVGVTLLRH